MRKNLTVILLYTPTAEIRGKLRRYFYEVKANVFVGTVSASVRDELWTRLESTQTEASMIVHVASEQGFIYKTTKESTDYIFEDFNGIILPTSIDTSLKMYELYAKPDYHLLDHLLDVGYIAEGLMTYGRAHSMLKAIAEIINLDLSKVISSIAWLCALHDIGKAHPSFIQNMYENSTNEQLIELYESLKERSLIESNNVIGFRHERFSRDLLKTYFKDHSYPRNALQFADLIAYHHQGKDNTDFCNPIKLTNSDWTIVHNKIFDLIGEHWQFDMNFSKNESYLNGIKYAILSIMITADWIASGSQWRAMLEHESDKKLCAEKFIKENQLYYEPMLKRFNDLKWSNVFDFKPNTLQQTTIKAAKDKPELMIVEYPCGGGKTEAALAAALSMGYDKSGIYIATPTMATAKSMTKRMQELSNKINLNIKIPEFDSSTLWSDDDMSKIPSELWVSKSRHRMLYPFAVGTIDQVLKTMLYYRYAAIGLMGLADKVLIIDEVHAYDSYMKTEIKLLLQWAKFLKIPVILLSATLPTITKLDLLKSIGCKQDNLPTDKSYPLITTYKDGISKCYPIEDIGKQFRFQIIETDNYMHAWLNEFKQDYQGCTAFIGSTVDNVWQLYNMASNCKLSPLMFNGRDTLAHKEEKTRRLLDLLGKNRQHRPNKLTVTATSIIEQSLDIDFDRMFTCIAPIDLLIQRFGRVWRHNDIGTIREIESIDKPITIIVPKNMNDLPTIYSKEILKRTFNVLKNKAELDTVLDARELIDLVYDSLDLIENPVEIMDASFKTIENPILDAMFDNDNLKYGRFKPIQSSTRFETYPSVSIAIVDPDDIVELDKNYDKIKKIMQQNVVGISLQKSRGIRIQPIKFAHKLISDINFYYKEDLANLGIFLTEDGLKWHNN